MYFSVNFDVFFKLMKVNLFVSELYIYILGYLKFNCFHKYIEIKSSGYVRLYSQSTRLGDRGFLFCSRQLQQIFLFTKHPYRFWNPPSLAFIS